MALLSYSLIAVLFSLQIALIYPFAKSMIPQKTNFSLLLKMICSTSFLLIGLLARTVSHSTGVYPMLIIIGLCLSWIGDLLLGLNGSKVFFVVGGFFFLLTHFCYIAAFSYDSFKTSPEKNVIGIFDILFCLILVLFFEIYNRKKKIDLGKLRIPALVYALILTTMLAKAIGFSKQLFLLSNDRVTALLVLFGAILFFVSDFTLTYTILEEKRKADVKYKFINSLSYFLAQTLIALSIMTIK